MHTLKLVNMLGNDNLGLMQKLRQHSQHFRNIFLSCKASITYGGKKVLCKRLLECLRAN